VEKAEGVSIEAPLTEWLSGVRCPPFQLTRGSGEHRELPQWAPGGASIENKFCAFCGR